jgi:DNA helicase IV
MSKYIYFKNIYFGKDSLVKVFYNKNRIEDEMDYDVAVISVLTDIADVLNQHALLTHFVYDDNQIMRPVLMEWNKHTIVGRLNVLIDFGHDYDKETKSLLEQFIEQLDRDDNYIKSLALYLAGIIASRKGLEEYYRQIYDRINQLKAIGILEPMEKVRKLYEMYRE